jgi:high-affinity nickel-transport protein
MISFFSILALGFFLGMRHATDADHVIAVSTIISREQRIAKSAFIGVFWGVGHTVTIFVVGAAIIFFNVVIPPRVGLSMELAVGLMLVVLGTMNLRTFARPATGAQSVPGLSHSHYHSHGDYVHKHTHSHAPEYHPHPPDRTPLAKLDHVLLKFRAYGVIRPLFVGIVHGLAGSAAVALLVLTAIHDPRWAVAYLLVFGVGTIAGMMLITATLASGFRLFGRGPSFSRRLTLASGLLSLGFGMVIAYQILLVNGFFTAHPHWIMR